MFSKSKSFNMDNPETKLIVYGSLAPGEANHFLVTGLVGEWRRCHIRGHMGRYRGFKSFRYDCNGPEHPAWLLESIELPRFLTDLDDFEGEEYQRIVIPAKVDGRWVMAQVYEGKFFD
ncbi:MAG: gamma-glutamylcyclotransferase [Thermodesulfobacteriota bacterium]